MTAVQARVALAEAERTADERRAEWRAGYDLGLRHGAQRVLYSHALATITFELLLLREVAARLGEQCDYWRDRSNAMEAEATYWHSIVARCGELLEDRGVRS
jgi:hypothetical protein